MSKRYLVTSALPYANGPLHLGHLAGAYLPADIYVRYLRLKKADVVYVCGSDEHGVPITIKAEKMGITPQQLVDDNYSLIKDTFEKVGISFDIFSRTSTKTHHETASEMFKKIYDKGLFVEKVSEQFYDEKNDQFLADRYIVGECPKCGYDSAYGDQCEKCGSTLSPQELINPKSAITGEVPILKETKHWYLPLDKYEDFLKKYIIEDHPEWKTNVVGQCKSWLDQGLQPRAVTRDLNWGVNVPIEGADGKVLYVWFDAPIGYISMTKEWAENQGKPDLWKSYWQDEDSNLIHFIGKDNIVFHAIIFPTMLHMDGDFIIPENVPANEFLNLEGDKLSTSRNYAVWVHEFLEQFDVDALRYYMTTILPETKDSDFSYKQFQSTYNSDLADVIGNFINRTFTFIHKFYEGKCPKRTTLDDLDELALDWINTISEKVAFHLERFENRKALEMVMEFARFGNKYFNDQAPWKSRKEDEPKCQTTLNISAHIVIKLAHVLQPFIPTSSQKISELFNLDQTLETFHWDDAIDLVEGSQFNEATIFFKKIEDEDVQPEIDRLEAIKQSKQEKQKDTDVDYKDINKEIEFETFTSVDLRVAEIIDAEPVPKTSKLLKIQVDLGFEKRQVVSGIAEHYDPKLLIGKKVMVVANLKPVKLRGEESNGMILASETEDGKIIINEVSSEIPNGQIIR
jgi:methionyl-tRNA synthetase